MAELPEFIGKYKVESLVARGGMGAVLKAVHPTLKRHVVLKKLTIRGSAAMAERFKREARILMDFRSENIVRVFDHFKEGASYYMVLEYVDGMSLDQLIKRQRFLSCELSMTILLEAAKALAYAHGMGVIHRDIKPGNILISRKGEIKLADFGIATTEEEEDSSLTREGMTLGTPCYMPPEQIENARNVDPRADLYSLGVMLYEMVTGKKPYPGNFSPETVLAIRKGKYRRPRKLNRTIHPFTERLIRKLMQPKPSRRFRDADTLVRYLERHLARFRKEPIMASLASMMQGACSEEPRYPKARRKRVWIPALLVLLAAIGFGAWYAWKTGYLYRWFMPGSYGSLSVELRVPRSGRHPSEVLAAARLFHDDGADMPESALSPLPLRMIPGQEADPWNSFASDTLYLAPGRYRLKLVADNAVLWQSFTVRPFSDKSAAGGSALRLRLDERAPQALSVKAEVRDAATGRELPYRLLVSHSGAWVNPANLPEGALTTGAVRQFRIESDGYRTQTFSLKIAVDQDTLVLSADLEPEGSVP